MKFEYKNHQGKRRFHQVDIKGVEFGQSPHTIEDKWLLVGADPTNQTTEKFVLEDIQRFCKPGDVQRLMCVTAYILNDDNQFFLMYHRKYNHWIPPGGKVEGNETPGEAAIRETFEETGLHIALISPDETPSNIPAPFGIQLNPIIKDSLDHVDMIYLGKAKSTEFALDASEAVQAQWFTLDQVLLLDTYPEVKKWCQYFTNRTENPKHKNATVTAL
ncbi:MAG: NUDIX domain-containing protein [Alphaproteobacteria bacterium]|nr:NUDIX domain-containing protein [Alphaproteobacteria bacterium]